MFDFYQTRNNEIIQETMEKIETVIQIGARYFVSLGFVFLLSLAIFLLKIKSPFRPRKTKTLLFCYAIRP